MAEYTIKDGEWVKIGEFPIEENEWARKHKRRKVNEDMVQGKIEAWEAVEQNPELIQHYDGLARSVQAFRRDKSATISGQRQPAKLIILTGRSGSGKTTLAKAIAKQLDLKIYTMEDVENRLAARYTDEGVLLLDNLSASNIPPYDWLVRLTDPHNPEPVTANAKYAHTVYLRPTYVILTGVDSPENWYRKKDGSTLYDEQLSRRIHKWLHWEDLIGDWEDKTPAEPIENDWETRVEKGLAFFR